MRLARLVVVVSVAARTAQAGTVGVVVTGDSELQATLATELDGWLRSHGHTIGESLPKDAASSVINCMVIDDEACARDIVDARAKTDSVVFSEIRKPRTNKSTATTVTVYWLVRGKQPVGMRQSCERCTATTLKSTLDEVLKTVMGVTALEKGSLTIHSRPEGANVMLDNEQVGITPFTRDLPVGPHHIVLFKNGRKAGERTIKIHAEAQADITIPLVITEEPFESKLPLLLMGGGAVALMGGVVLFVTSETDDGSRPFYRETRPAGISIAIGGLALAGVGAWLYLKKDKMESMPMATVDQHGGMIGWSRAF